MKNIREPKTWINWILRLVDISFLGILYLIGGIIVSSIITMFFPKYDEEVYKFKSYRNLTLEIFSTAALLCVLGYVLRNIVRKIPFPLDGLFGYQHQNRSEIRGGIIISFAIFVLLTDFRKKITMYSQRNHKFFNDLKLKMR